MDSRQIERSAAAWLARREGGAWSERDRAALDAWLAAATAHRVAFLRLEAAWRESDRLKALGAGLPSGAVPPRGHWSRFTASGTQDVAAMPASEADDAPAARPRREPLDAAALVFAPRPVARQADAGIRATAVGAAASVLLVAALALGWRGGPAAPEPVAYGTALGDVRALSLADGSDATLSSDSRMVVALSRRERRVELQRGEAFFHAARDPGRPFVVAVGERRVVAVGTRFAVRRDGDGVRVVVTEGLVRLESGPGPDGRARPTTLLPAGSIARASGAGVQVQSGAIEQAERYLSWREGFLSFRDTPLADAAAEFNRYGTRKLVLGDAEVAAMRVGGNFRWSNTDGFVRLLEQGFGIRAERRAEAVVLHSR